MQNEVSLIALQKSAAFYFEQGHYPEALQAFHKLLHVASKEDDPKVMAHALCHLGLVYWLVGMPEDALQYHLKHLQVVEASADVAAQVMALGNIGNAHEHLFAWDKALLYHQRALSMAEAVGDVAGQATSWANIGNVQDKLGQFSPAIHAFQMALQLGQSCGDTSTQSLACSYLAKVAFNAGDLCAALDFVKQELQMAEQENLPLGQCRALANLGNIRLAQGEAQKAVDDFSKQALLAQSLNEVSHQTTAELGLGCAHMQLGDMARGQQHLLCAVKLSASSGDMHMQLSSLTALGFVVLGRKPTQAVDYFQQALAISDGDDTLGFTASAQLGLGVTALVQTDFGGAQALFQQVVPMAQQSGDLNVADVATVGVAVCASVMHQFEGVPALLQSILENKGIPALVMGKLLCLLGNAQYSQGEHQLAKAAYQQALVYLEQQPPPPAAPWLYTAFFDSFILRALVAACEGQLLFGDSTVLVLLWKIIALWVASTPNPDFPPTCLRSLLALLQNTSLPRAVTTQLHYYGTFILYRLSAAEAHQAELAAPAAVRLCAGLAGGAESDPTPPTRPQLETQLMATKTLRNLLLSNTAAVKGALVGLPEFARLPAALQRVPAANECPGAGVVQLQLLSLLLLLVTDTYGPEADHFGGAVRRAGNSASAPLVVAVVDAPRRSPVGGTDCIAQAVVEFLHRHIDTPAGADDTALRSLRLGYKILLEAIRNAGALPGPAAALRLAELETVAKERGLAALHADLARAVAGGLPLGGLRSASKASTSASASELSASDTTTTFESLSSASSPLPSPRGLIHVDLESE